MTNYVCMYVWISGFLHTYINAHYNPSVRIINLVSYIRLAIFRVYFLLISYAPIRYWVYLIRKALLYTESWHVKRLVRSSKSPLSSVQREYAKNVSVFVRFMCISQRKIVSTIFKCNVMTCDVKYRKNVQHQISRCY